MLKDLKQLNEKEMEILKSDLKKKYKINNHLWEKIKYGLETVTLGFDDFDFINYLSLYYPKYKINDKKAIKIFTTIYCHFNNGYEKIKDKNYVFNDGCGKLKIISIEKIPNIGINQTLFSSICLSIEIHN